MPSPTPPSSATSKPQTVPPAKSQTKSQTKPRVKPRVKPAPKGAGSGKGAGPAKAPGKPAVAPGKPARKRGRADAVADAAAPAAVPPLSEPAWVPPPGFLISTANVADTYMYPVDAAGTVIKGKCTSIVTDERSAWSRGVFKARGRLRNGDSAVLNRNMHALMYLLSRDLAAAKRTGRPPALKFLWFDYRAAVEVLLGELPALSTMGWQNDGTTKRGKAARITPAGVIDPVAAQTLWTVLREHPLTAPLHSRKRGPTPHMGVEAPDGSMQVEGGRVADLLHGLHVVKCNVHSAEQAFAAAAAGGTKKRAAAGAAATLVASGSAASGPSSASALASAAPLPAPTLTPTAAATEAAPAATTAAGPPAATPGGTEEA